MRIWQAAWGAGVAIALLVCLAGCRREGPLTYQGYVEAEYVYVAAPLAGELKVLNVERGAQVITNAPLFALDLEPEATDRNEAMHRVSVTRQRWEDLKKGQRPSEIESLEARRKQAEVSLHLAELELKRVETLNKDKVASADELDRVKTSRDFYQAQVAQYKADIETARLGGREDLVQAGQAEVAAAEAALARAEWNVQQKSQSSPVTGLVHDTLYRPGEWVAAGRPVVVLLPPANLKVRFFVPQAILPQLKPGLTVEVHLDGAAAPLSAAVSYVSTQAEFTPPVIYSRETRAKLVFMVEARFQNPDPSLLRPGQPVDVRWAAAP